ncbi:MULTISPECIES: guanine deaminase [Spirulina sp. CCY15215]|uniref:guanine deaminase n=1 Tax=Spirulina sp. CCY15215 TaxID=2767591 RepID=UPI00194EB93A|nr:guanine deaminase [Spirulina major]
MNLSAIKGFRGAFLDFVGDPFYVSELESVRYFPDGLLVIENGMIQDFGDYAEMHSKYTNLSITHYRDRLILPGFIDTHIHFPQTEMIAAYGEQLLEWLHQYTFPTERKFKEKSYAKKMASFFLDELLRNGTTTALVFTTIFPESVDAFFEAAGDRNLRAIAGKVMMDCNAPDYLKDTAQSSYEETKALIQKWHKNERLLYAVTPRFAATSSEKQLQLAGKLLAEFPDVYLHTHLSENVKEVEWIRELFPHSQNYLDVYDRAGLVGDRSIFAHGVQLSPAEFKRLSEANSAISFCPTSNLFLGSGLFKLQQAKSQDTPIKVGLGTDVGAGTSFSLLQTANEAYKVSQLQGKKLSSFQALFLATLGGAKALNLEEKIGNFDVGKEADFIVVNLQATPLMALRNSGELPQTLAEISDRTFALMMLGDDRAISATYILGDRAKIT